MVYIGIDYHKKYSVASAIDETGRIVQEARIEGNTVHGFQAFLKSLGEPAKVVIEACWNWGFLFDRLSEMPEIKEIVVAHPYKVRIIAESQIKTDKLDARKLAQLLRVDMIPSVYIPRRETRQKKDWLRQRVFWVRQRTRIRNRVHALLNRQRDLNLPQMSDLFGTRGMNFMSQVVLPEPDGSLLKQDIAVMRTLAEQIKEIEKTLAREETPEIGLLTSLPGIGHVLGNVIAAEIDRIDRFPDSRKLCAYSGLVPTTHASGGKEYHGKLVPMCNKWLRWALVEAAWVAVGCSGYFGGLYRRHRALGKGANKSIIIVARRMCEIVWKVLSERRPYEDRPFVAKIPGRSHHSLAVSA